MSSIDQVEMIWNKVLEGLNNNQSISDKDMMNGFMAALTPRILSEKVMILSIGDEWTKDYIESNYRSFINEELNKVTGRNCETTIVLSENQTQGKRQTEPQEEDKQEQIESTDIGVEKKTSINNDLNTRMVSESFTKQGDEHQRSQSDNATQEIVFHNSNNQIDTRQDNVQRNRTQGFRKTFDTFVVADTNKLAYGAAYSVAENPGLINNPLFIYGRSGLGKTHLLLAIKDYM
ncbi:MAG TPA: DnaA/Hda family protein, partial [Methanocorpusculum sp.]|nr:DnaA/Hda family protein [Methanocorpusculum sp.]